MSVLRGRFARVFIVAAGCAIGLVACENGGPTQPAGQTNPSTPAPPPPPPPPSQNQAPSVQIGSPQNGASFVEGTNVVLQGSGTDPEDGTLSGTSLAWSSSLDGQVGVGASVSASSLSIGTHTITLTGTDSEGASASASIQVNVDPQPAIPDLVPGLFDVSPNDPSTSETITINGRIRNDGVAGTGAPVAWRIAVDGVEVASGQVAALAAGANSTQFQTTAGPFASGPHTATLEIDAANQISEADENNNSASDGFTVAAAPPPPASGFDLELRFLSSPTASQAQAFAAAESRWEAVINGDLPDVPLNVSSGSCHPAVNETIDDLVIFVELSNIDGPGGVLGSAGPCFLRVGSQLPLTGRITLDTSDLQDAEAVGLLEDLVLHEMGHVLGFGTLWPTLGLLTGGGSPDPYFTGAEAVDAFFDVGGGSYSGNPVPVENTGSPGTRDGHWRETIFGTELMTGFLSVGSNPMSRVTVAALEDQGFAVNHSAADPFNLGLSALLGEPGERFRIGADMWTGPIFLVSPDGRVLEPIR